MKASGPGLAGLVPGRSIGRAALVILSTLALTSPARAEDEELLIPDRPHFTESTHVVMLHRAVIEGGASVSIDRDARSISGPEFLLRYTALPRLEFRLGLPDFSRTSTSRAVVKKLEESTVALKLQMLPTLSRFGLAVLPGFTIPADEDDRGDAAPEVTVAWSAPSLIGVRPGGSIKQEWREDARRGADRFSATLAVERGLTGRLGTFLEWSAEFPDHGEASHVLHLGYSFGLSVDGQIDIHGGVGVTDAAPDIFFGAGIAVRR